MLMMKVKTTYFNFMNQSDESELLSEKTDTNDSDLSGFEDNWQVTKLLISLSEVR